MRKIFSGRSAGDFRGDVSEAGRPACGSTRWPPGVWRRIGGRKARHAEDLIFAERVADSLFRSSERSHRRASCARFARGRAAGKSAGLRTCLPEASGQSARSASKSGTSAGARKNLCAGRRARIGGAAEGYRKFFVRVGGDRNV